MKKFWEYYETYDSKINRHIFVVTIIEYNEETKKTISTNEITIHNLEELNTVLEKIYNENIMHTSYHAIVWDMIRAEYVEKCRKEFENSEEYKTAQNNLISLRPLYAKLSNDINKNNKIVNKIYDIEDNEELKTIDNIRNFEWR